jgi:hypothetical protein
MSLQDFILIRFPDGPGRWAVGESIYSICQSEAAPVDSSGGAAYNLNMLSKIPTTASPAGPAGRRETVADSALLVGLGVVVIIGRGAGGI